MDLCENEYQIIIIFIELWEHCQFMQQNADYDCPVKTAYWIIFAGKLKMKCYLIVNTWYNLIWVPMIVGSLQLFSSKVTEIPI